MTSVSTSKRQPHLLAADDYLFQLTATLEACSSADLASMRTLSRLRASLTVAISTYEQAIRTRAADDVILMKQADLLWQCNQCSYYLSHPVVAAPPGALFHRLPSHRSLWQIRAAVIAVTHFKLLTYLRRVMPGTNIVSLSWRDILPGFRLWLVRSRSSSS